MKKPEINELFDAGAHFGHLTRKWNPNMAPYIYGAKNKTHIINLFKTIAQVERAQKFLKNMAASGRKILFVSTKKQAKDIVAKYAESVKMPYITERWPGGMLTNFVTIRKAIKKMDQIDKMKKDGSYETLSKKEKLHMDRLRAKLEKNLGSIKDMTRLPAALIVVDINKEHVAVKEANKLGIPIVALVDTNADPRQVTFPIPANDDSSSSIDLILKYLASAISEGLEERQLIKQRAKQEKEESKKNEKAGNGDKDKEAKKED